MSRLVALIAGGLVVAAVLACSGEGDSMPRGCGQLPLYDLTEFPDLLDNVPEDDQPTPNQKAAIDTAARSLCITGVGTASTEPPSRSGSGGSAGSTGSGGTPADAGAADGGDAAP